MAHYYFDRCSENNLNEIQHVAEIDLHLEEVDEEFFGGIYALKERRVWLKVNGLDLENFVEIKFDPRRRDYPLGVQTSYGCRNNKRTHFSDITLVHRLKDICGAQEIVDGSKMRYDENEFNRFDPRTKRDILRVMGDIAEGIYMLAIKERGIIIYNFGVPKAINVGTGEKKIFKDIVENREKEIVHEMALIMPGHQLSSMGKFSIASNCLLRDYFPKYGEYRSFNDIKNESLEALRG